MTRALNDNFFKRFLPDGNLSELTEALQVLPQFMLNFRENYATIYYKGMRVLEIIDDGSADGIFGITADAYLTAEELLNSEFSENISDFKDSKSKYMFKLEMSNKKDWFTLLTFIANGIDNWRLGYTEEKLQHENPEKEIQQRIVLENNIFGNSNSTDYFIIDTEYKEQGNRNAGRFDAIALHWSRDMRNHRDYKPGLAFIEVKVGEGAIKGTSGINKHLDDIIKYDITDDFCADIEKNIFQLYTLGLISIPGSNIFDSEKSEKKQFKIDRNKTPQMIFALANYNQKSGKILEQLEKVAEPKELDLRFATSSFLGYGLYDEGMLKLDEFKQLLTKNAKE